ncbi:MAG: flagellar brake protein [Ectothiorhodospiraceae bacterium]|jgi:hypothetical protein|nr:flagellar brake protein [Ectothiorhodospiraceae bacterium]
MSLAPVDREQLDIGTPLPWSLFDPQQNPILARGEVIRNPEHLLAILERSPCRDSSEDAAPDPEPLVEGNWGDDETPPDTDQTGETSFPFEEMRLKVGDRLQLQPPHHLSTERFIVKLVGYVTNTSLLVTAPYVNGLRLPLLGNEKIVLRAFTAQNAFAFSSVINKICKLPFDYLHLSFPTEIRGAVVRKAPRVNTRIIATIANVSRDDASQNAPGIVANISASGARVDARQKLGEVGDDLKLFFRIHLHDIATYLSTDAVIRSLFVDDPAAGGESSLIHHGLEFKDLQPNEGMILKSFIYQQMIERPGALI